MTWQPIALADLRLLLHSSTDELSAGSRTLFEQLAVGPYQVNCRRFGRADPERVYVVAQSDRLLLIYDDVEDEFGVGRATVDGILLKWALCGSLESALRVLTDNYERPARVAEFEALFKANPNAVFRVWFMDGDAFVLRLVRDSSNAAGVPDTWTGVIVAHEGLSERRQKFFVVDSGLDFRLGDIQTIDIVEVRG